ncbi:hypothetical protein G7Y89_g4127 [Cudoniella acicularis]|uniref:BTB domain-containing protein n=1 Tax=Cudoniella acicularis TaxID=354080 RepID=A0A8H4RQ22_9HELO|nr:hypothetical protein G7Y89_g4127 [Cudoniella acicularis]
MSSDSPNPSSPSSSSLPPSDSPPTEKQMISEAANNPPSSMPPTGFVKLIICVPTTESLPEPKTTPKVPAQPTNASDVLPGAPFTNEPAPPTLFGEEVLDDSDSTEQFTEHEFILPKERICKVSPVFKSAFNGPFIEGQTQTMRIKDVEVETIKIFKDSLEGKRLHIKYSLLPLAKFWFFADRYLMPDLRAY